MKKDKLKQEKEVVDGSMAKEKMTVTEAQALIEAEQTKIDKQCLDEILAILKKYGRDFKAESHIVLTRK